jgi:hypothetical protein
MIVCKKSWERYQNENGIFGYQSKRLLQPSACILPGNAGKSEKIKRPARVLF